MHGSRSMHRFHPRATKPAPPDTVALPRDVRASGCREDGTGYLFRPGELLVPQDQVLAQHADLTDALDEAGAIPWEEFIASRTPQDPDYPEGMPQHQRDVLDAKRAARTALRERGLAVAGLQRLVIPQLADPENAEADDIPDVIDRLLSNWRAARPEPEPSDPEKNSSPEPAWPVYPHIVATGEDDDGVFGPGEPVRQLDEFFQPEVVDGLGEGIRIGVIDTGVRQDHQWLFGHCEARELVDEETLDTAPPFGQLDFEAGHGTFIAGVIRQFAPSATLVMRGVVDSMGIIDDLTLAGAIDELAEEPPLHILNLSLGGYIHDPLLLAPDGTELTIRDFRVQRLGLPATAAAIERLRQVTFDQHGIRLVVTAAAGNNGMSRPFYPAALPKVIGVGALNQDFSKAIWSNHGDWVDAWEVGANVVSSFVGPHLDQRGGGGSGKEGAFWGGTSFAAPRLAGLLAAAMTV